MKYASYILSFIIILPAAALAQGPRQQPEWVGVVDVNRDGKIDPQEYRAAAEAFFKKADRNANGVLERIELPGRPEGKRPTMSPGERPVPPGERRPPMSPGERPGPPGERRPPMSPSEVPPFLFLDRDEGDMNLAQFTEAANARFARIDANGDKFIDFEEIRAVRPPERRPGPDPLPGPGVPPRPGDPMARFLGAEMRFGGKTVKNAPFSAETVREEQKRLFDGTLVKTESRGAVYRDGEGRMRHEQQFDAIGGFRIVGDDDRPKRIVHIIDPVSGKTYSLNADSKTYVNVPFQQRPPLEREGPLGAKTESLGKQTIEGVTAEGTRTTFEIPAGQIGNDRPVFVVTEKWYSPELQMVIMSRHVDPIAGEVVFKLVNIKLGEPSSDLFRVPADYKRKP